MANTTVQINGKTYNLPSGNISVIDNKIYCDGKLVENCNEIKDKVISIKITGDNCHVSCASGDIIINGSAVNAETQSGDISITGNVDGTCRTVSGDITVKGDIHGDCHTVSGDITAKRIGAMTMGYQDTKECGRRLVDRISDYFF